jgi:hypothetical protein
LSAMDNQTSQLPVGPAIVNYPSLALTPGQDL